MRPFLRILFIILFSFSMGCSSSRVPVSPDDNPRIPDIGAERLIWAIRVGNYYTDEVNAIASLSDNSVVITGDGSLLPGQHDFFIARYNPDGNLAWVKDPPAWADTDGTGIVALSDNTVVVTGYYDHVITFGAGESNETTLRAIDWGEIFVARYFPDGSLAWATQALGAGSEKPYDIIALPDDSFVLTGEFTRSITFGLGEPNETTLVAYESGYYPDFIARYNPDGTIAWAKHLDVYSVEVGMTALSDNTIVVAGTFTDSIIFGEGEPGETRLVPYNDYNIFIVRYFPDGTLAWAKQIKGYGNNRTPRVSARSDGSFILSGWFGDTAIFGEGEPNETTLESIRAYDNFVALYYPDGTLAWAKHICGPSPAFDKILSLPDNTIVACGEYSGSTQFNGCDPEPSILEAIGWEDIYYVRFYPDGTFARASRAAGLGYGTEEGIAALSDNSIVVTGYFTETITFGEGQVNETTLVSAGSRDIFIARFIP